MLLVDDDDAFRSVLAAELKRMHFSVSAAATAAEALRRVVDDEPDVVLLDLRLPDVDGLEALRRIRQVSPATDVIMLTGHGSLDEAVESIRIGAFDYVTKPCPLDELDIRIRRALERQALRRRNSLLERGLTPPDLRSAFIGDSPAFRQLLDLIERVAATDSTVLVTGETGTGKEMVAKLLHARSARRHRPFVVVECAALQETLLQNELFGHERGAFTGADRAKSGLFEVAHGGTIFLDEIGEVSLATQVKLLRVLDTSCFRHVGGTTEIHVDVRVLAATNRNLADMVAQGVFREDLYYRLRTVELRLPALRDRCRDVELLAGHFVGLMGERFAVRKHLGPAALDLLRHHDWPGNVRELMHVIEAAVVVSEGPEIRPEHLSIHARQAPAMPAPPDTVEGRLPTLEEMERTHIERALRAARGHRGHAASALGISERNLYRKLRSYGLLS
ncbi:Transcriptional regulatory protein ZraR [Luteitalea pratensis]|uniref:Transcriptional regulatory protein ZraR n=1 Tax=Luteitalea pratensis TaxID=1855912 RepID=A0A143PH35_LUTPR|nr:sigma-54 dependent transcriptional regulator [Luteitalea pratensis]AMY07074.1 Transcriptional regulatory protein ZraR [Luteitalea pratensis]